MAPKKNRANPALKGGAVYRAFTFTIVGDKTYRAQYSIDTANGDFLKPTSISWGNFPWEYTQPGKSDFERLIETPQFQTGIFASISELKGQMRSQGRFDLGTKAANTSKQNKSWNDTPTQQNPDNPTPVAMPPNWTPPDPVAPINTDGLIQNLEEESEKSAQETIRSLNPPNPSDQSQASTPVTLSYPIDASYSNTQDHVTIEQFTYRAPQESLFPLSSVAPQTTPFDLITGGLTRNSNLKKFIGIVRLPIPNQLSISNGVSWGEDRANPVEAAAFFGALGTVNTAIAQGNIGGALVNLGSGTADFLSKIADGSFAGNAPAALLLSSFISQYALGKFGINVDPAQFIARGTGTTINPNLELLFNGPKLRSFSFTFQFAPVGVNDAKEARRIMRFFKQGMAAKRLETNTIFLASPNVFRISYRGTGNKSIKGLNRFKICALTSCELNYTPEGVYQSYDDPDAVSMPVRTSMTLSFTELTPIFEQDYRTQNDPSIIDIFDPFGSSLQPQDEITYDDIGF